MTEFVHQLDLLEHVIPIGPVLVQFQDHHFVTRFMCDLQNKNFSGKTVFSTPLNQNFAIDDNHQMLLKICSHTWILTSADV